MKRLFTGNVGIKVEKNLIQIPKKNYSGDSLENLKYFSIKINYKGFDCTYFKVLENELDYIQTLKTIEKVSNSKPRKYEELNIVKNNSVNLETKIDRVLFIGQGKYFLIFELNKGLEFIETQKKRVEEIIKNKKSKQ